MAPKSIHTWKQYSYMEAKLPVGDASRHAILIDCGIYRLLLFLLIFSLLQRSMQIQCTFLQEMLSMHDQGKKWHLRKFIPSNLGFCAIIHVHVCLFEQSKLMVDIFLLNYDM